MANKFEIIGKLNLAKDNDKRKCFEELRFKKGEKNKQGFTRKDDFVMRNLRLTIKSNEDFFNVDIKGSLFGNENTAKIKSMIKVGDNNYEEIEFKYKDREKYVHDLAEFKKCVFVEGDEREEFIDRFDFSLFVHEYLSREENSDKLVKIVGDIEYSEYTKPGTDDAKVYTNYNINRIYVVKDGTEQSATGTIEMFINENAIDDSLLEDEGVFKISGYASQYVNKNQPNRGFFQVLDYPLDKDDEKFKVRCDVINKLFTVEDCELAKIGVKVKLINRVEEVDFDESMLDDEDRLLLECGIITISDLQKQYGRGKGGYINKTEITNINATYRKGCVPTELTLQQILDDGMEKKPETTGKDIELDLENGLSDEDLDDLFA